MLDISTKRVSSESPPAWKLISSSSAQNEHGDRKHQRRVDEVALPPSFHELYSSQSQFFSWSQWQWRAILD